MINQICEESKCTACFACKNICPAGAIDITENEIGITRPVISSSCIDCNACVSTCPSNNLPTLLDIKSAYAVYSRNDEIRNKSASGGLIYEIAKAFDGIVYGAALTDGADIKHIRIDSKDELYKIQGSKYALSVIGNAYKLAKKDLDSGKKVLFTGTPCQIAGLKSYLKKDCPLLYTIDFACHGIVEPRILRDYIKKQIKSNDLSGINVSFRDSNGYNITVSNLESGKIKTIPFNQSFYMHGYLEGWTLRENCYNCIYSRPKRVSDITACDFWGVDEPLKKELKKGLNAALIITPKGQELFDSVKERLFVEERTPQEVIRGNKSLLKPMNYDERAKRFSRLYTKKGSNFALENTVLKKRLVFAARKILNK
ncbi:MAG: Coenzyme F420 hydrogenase/dehydrogenase, beta subunit C-terminal domain [Eubacterium sp.]